MSKYKKSDGPRILRQAVHFIGDTAKLLAMEKAVSGIKGKG